MATLTAPTEQILTLGDLLNRLGGVSPDRVRMTPPRGHATEADVIDAEARENCLCELVDGTLVEKAMGFTRTIAVYTAPDHVSMLTESQTLDGGEVLQGFVLPVKDLFAELERTEAR